MKSRKLSGIVLASISIVVLLSLSLQLTSAGSGSTGAWRLLNPTEYTANPTSNLNGVFMINGGTSGVNSGDGWAVGDNGLIFYWNGFAWNQGDSPLTAGCTLNAVNFGGPLNPVQNGVQTTSGWVVGGGTAGCASNPSEAISLYWNGVGWQSYPMPATGTSEAGSVFLVESASSTTGPVIAVAVGSDASGGEIWTWNGVPGITTGWVESSVSPTPNQLNSVYMTTEYGSTCTGSGIWGAAVGNSGTILTDCGTWTTQGSPTANNLYGVAMSSTTSGWAVGDLCTIIHTTNGVTWSAYTGPTPCTDPTRPLRSIVLLSSSEGWAVGDSDSNGHPVILHGTSLDSSPLWTQIPVNQVTPNGLPSSVGLNSVTFATSGNNLWAVGASGIAAFCQNNCSSMSGSIWSTTTSPLTGSATGHQLNAVFMDSDSDGWAVGSNDLGAEVLYQWNGYSWTQAPSVSTITTAPLYGIYMQGSSNAWAVGGTGTVASTLYYNGNTWQGLAAPSCSCSLQSVFMTSGSETWAVGTNGVIMHSTTQGGSFGTTTSPVAGFADLDAVYFDSSQSGWAGGTCSATGPNCVAVGDPIIIHTLNDGGDNWATVFAAGVGLPTPSGTSYTVTSLFFQDSTHGWASLKSGNTNPTALYYWNGISWTLVSPTTTLPDDDLYGVSVEGGTPATDGWAVGVTSAGIPLTIHYTGGAWTEESLSPAIPNPGTLLGLYLRSSTNGLAVGTNAGSNSLGYVLHLDPPGAFQNTVAPQTNGQISSQSTSSGSGYSTSESSTSSASESATSSATSSSATSSIVTSSSATTLPPTVTSPVTSTVASTSVPTITPAVTPTIVSSTIAVSTPMVLPAIPGFPWESIIAGLMLGAIAVAVVRRIKK